jgi:hypothetical protein
MPKLIRFLLSHFADGAILGLLLSEAILVTDFARLASLVATSGQGGALTILFFAQSAMVFGTLNLAVGVLTLPVREP